MALTLAIAALFAGQLVNLKSNFEIRLPLKSFSSREYLAIWDLHPAINTGIFGIKVIMREEGYPWMWKFGAGSYGGLNWDTSPDLGYT